MNVLFSPELEMIAPVSYACCELVLTLTSQAVCA